MYTKKITINDEWKMSFVKKAFSLYTKDPHNIHTAKYANGGTMVVHAKYGRYKKNQYIYIDR